MRLSSAEFCDFVGEVFGGEHGGEAAEGDVRGDEEERAGEGDGECRGEVCARRVRRIQAAAGPRAKAMRARAAGRRRAAKDAAGEVEEVGHGEGVVADAAVGEEVADVGDEGVVAGGPEAVGEGGVMRRGR